MICLGIESTAHTIGVGIAEGKRILANAKRLYKTPAGQGILPRAAANHHEENIVPLLREALSAANLSMRDIDLFAFSRGPGIGQCLRVSCASAKFLASKLQKPMLGINHCQAHLEVSRGLLGMEDPLYVYVSGANTQLIAQAPQSSTGASPRIAGSKARTRASMAIARGKPPSPRFLVLGETLDIGLGNLFDVFAREAKFAYPHGSEVAKLAQSGSYFPLPYTVKGMNFAFAGLLTSALREVGKKRTEDICHSLLETAFAEVCEASERALCLTSKKELTVCGGVAQNARFCEMLSSMCEGHNARFSVVAPEYNADNGAMIAYTALREWGRGKRERMEGLSPNGYWRIDEVY